MKPLIGKIISNQMQKTAVVEVEIKWQHPVYKKTVKRTKKYIVHDESGSALGQLVTITQTKPLSRRKRWTIVTPITSSTKKSIKKPL